MSIPAAGSSWRSDSHGSSIRVTSVHPGIIEDVLPTGASWMPSAGQRTDPKLSSPGDMRTWIPAFAGMTPWRLKAS